MLVVYHAANAKVLILVMVNILAVHLSAAISVLNVLLFPQVVGDGTHTVGQALRTTAQEHCMTTFSLALADSHAEVDLEAPAHLLDGDIILLQDASDSVDLSNGR